jgi:nicotinate-nucleotide adenylyltransferase
VNSSVGADWIEPSVGRVGILGGTFDPVHYGHLVAAEQVREALGLDLILFVPAGSPPHKRDDVVAMAGDRAAMVELAIAGNGRFAMSRIEMERAGPSYTVDTLAALADEAARQRVAREFFFILSAEALAGFAGWRDPARVLGLASLVVVSRPGTPLPSEDWLAANLPGGAASVARVHRIETTPLAHSSSDIRARLLAGRSVRYLLPSAVEAYIRDHRLYRSRNPQRIA